MPLPDTCPLTEFRRDAAGYLKRLRKSKKPLLLTQDGRAAGVVMSTAEYDRLMAEMEAAEVRAALDQAFEEMKAGKGRPADVVFRELRAELLPKKRRSPRSA
jgi:prevent-host-death family protein